MPQIKKIYVAILTFILIAFVVACTPGSTESPEDGEETLNLDSTEVAVIDTVTPPQESASPLPPPVIVTSSSTSIPEDSQPEIGPSEAETTPTARPTVAQSTKSPIYQVAFVEQDDVLNVRGGPGVDFEILDELEPGEEGLVKVGSDHSSSNDLWYHIKKDERLDGWVNSYYLVEIIESDSFCDSPEVESLIDELLVAMSQRDGEMLEDLVAASRGIGFRRNWWNPEVYFPWDQVSEIFDDTTQRSWGTADGSGEAIEGSFSTVMGPLITENLLNYTDIGCNEIIHAGTAGLVILPESYEGINYISLHRAPGADEFELDWGTWVVGIETWEGKHSIRYMVHYEWEI